MVLQNVNEFMKILILLTEKRYFAFLYFGGIGYVLTISVATANLEYLELHVLFLCICITDVDFLKHVENYSYSFVLEGDNLL